MIPPANATIADHTNATCTLSVSSWGGSVVSRPTAVGRTATASNPASRATALLTPDATPRSLSSAAASTVDVSGATVAASPRPNTTAAGNTDVQYDSPGSMRV